MNRFITYGLGGVVGLVVLYNSIYIQHLSEVKAGSPGSAASTNTFQAEPYARTFWTSRLLPSAPKRATPLDTLLAALQTNKDQAFTKHAHALGIGNIGYFLVKGQGMVRSVNKNEVVVTLSSGQSVSLATEYIFGNAVRDASGLIDITDFDNTADLNSLSAQLNELVRKQTLPVLREKAKPGRPISFVGALELNQAHLHLQSLTLIPMLIQ